MAGISWVNEQIALSGAFFDEDVPLLKKNNIDAIVDVRSESCDNRELLAELGFNFLHINVDDRYAPTFEQLGEIFNFVEPLLDKGKKVLVHCQNGCGRSPLVVVAILVKRGMNLADAVYLVEDKHPWTGFTPEQEKFIYTELDKFLESKNVK